MAIFSYYVLVAALAVGVSADCYSHDGIKARDSKYYFGDELVSCGGGSNNCCLKGNKCGTNLLCIGTDGGTARQYCSSSTWDKCSDMCPQNDAAGVSLRDCGNNIYCCGGGADVSCCTNSTLAFYVDPDDGSVTKTTKAAKTNKPRFFTVNTSAILAGSTSVPASTSASSASSADASTTASSQASTQPSSSSSSATGAPVTSPSDAPAKSSGISGGAGAGIGIGIVVALALVGALIWYFLRKRKQNAASPYAAPPPAPEKTGPPQSYYAHTYSNASEMPGLQHQTQELDGGVYGGAQSHELDGGAGSQPKIHPGA